MTVRDAETWVVWYRKDWSDGVDGVVGPFASARESDEWARETFPHPTAWGSLRMWPPAGARRRGSGKR